MNFTRFVIYFNRCGPGHEDGKIGAAGSSDPAGVSESAAGDASEPQRAQIQSSGVDIKSHSLVRELYVQNCDKKIVGNLSSIYQTLISLFNLTQNKFYYPNEIVNVFMEKMEATIMQL